MKMYDWVEVTLQEFFKWALNSGWSVPRLNRVTLVERPRRAHYLSSMMGRFIPRPLYSLERPPDTHFLLSLMDRSTPRPFYHLERPPGTHFLWSLLDRSTARPPYSLQKTTRYPLFMKYDGPDSPVEYTVLKCLCLARDQNADYPAVHPVAWPLHSFGYSSPRRLV
jgi:hypothetical protein